MPADGKTDPTQVTDCAVVRCRCGPLGTGMRRGAWDTMIVYGHVEATRELSGRLRGVQGTEEHERSKQIVTTASNTTIPAMVTT